MDEPGVDMFELHRPDFICSLIGSLIGIAIAAVGFAEQFNSPLFGWVFVLTFLLFPVALRFQSLGYSGTCCISLLIPFVNVVSLFACAALPSSFRTTRRFDGPAILLSLAVIVVILFWGLAYYADWRASQPIR
jgi:hypothetical protein